MSEDNSEANAKSADYLTPFLLNVTDVTKISKDEAKEARESCLRALKDRLLDRANIIQKRLDEENTQLSKRQVKLKNIFVYVRLLLEETNRLDSFPLTPPGCVPKRERS